MKTIKEIRQDIESLNIQIANSDDDLRVLNLESRILRLEVSISIIQLKRARAKIKRLKYK